jgi:hypothetical protein
MLGLCSEGGNMHFLHSSGHFPSMIGNLVLKVLYFKTLQKTKCISSRRKVLQLGSQPVHTATTALYMVIEIASNSPALLAVVNFNPSHNHR